MRPALPRRSAAQRERSWNPWLIVAVLAVCVFAGNMAILLRGTSASHSGAVSRQARVNHVRHNNEEEIENDDPLNNSANRNGADEQRTRQHGAIADSLDRGLAGSREAPGSTASDVVLLTYASDTGRDTNFDYSLVSAARTGLPVRLLGFGEPWRGLTSKFIGVLAELARIPPDTLVVFADAFDVLYMVAPDGDAAAVAGLFRSRFESVAGARQAAFVFGGELGCWPYLDGRRDGERLCEEVYPRAPPGSPYRFLNSGVWMARAGAARTHIEALVRAYNAQGDAGMNDQELATNLFVHGRPGVEHNITLDYHNSLFQNLHMHFDVLRVPASLAEPVRNTVTGGSPLLVHFNGGAKGEFDRVRKELDTRLGTGMRPSAPNITLVGSAGRRTVPLDQLVARIWPSG